MHGTGQVPPREVHTPVKRWVKTNKTSNVLSGREFNSAAVPSDRSGDADERWGGRWLQVGGSGGPHGGGVLCLGALLVGAGWGDRSLGAPTPPRALLRSRGRGGRTPHVQVHAFT